MSVEWPSHAVRYADYEFQVIKFHACVGRQSMGNYRYDEM